MRDPQRIPIILDKINQIWSKCPNQRFLQLMHNLCNFGDRDLFFVEDQEFERTLDDFINFINGF